LNFINHKGHEGTQR